MIVETLILTLLIAFVLTVLRADSNTLITVLGLFLCAMGIAGAFTTELGCRALSLFWLTIALGGYSLAVSK